MASRITGVLADAQLRAINIAMDRLPVLAASDSLCRAEEQHGERPGRDHWSSGFIRLPPLVAVRATSPV